jgi:hypothetical protein
MGILNLPISSLQTRHESSQVLFPANVALWKVMSSEFIGGAGLDCPNCFRTKAEMLGNLPAEAWKLICETSTCDAP